MPLKSLMRRRPSAAIVISCVALFMSLGGVGYAAISIPNNSVGAAQLKSNAVTNSKINNGAVSYKKIQPGAVGIVRANTGQLQVRVSGACQTGSAIGTINQVGKVTCNNALPSEFGTTNNTRHRDRDCGHGHQRGAARGRLVPGLRQPVGPPSPAAPPQQHVTVTCTLTVGSNTETRSVTIDTHRHARHTRTAVDPAAGDRSVRHRLGELHQHHAGSGTAPDDQRDLGDQRHPDRQQQLGAHRGHTTPATIRAAATGRPDRGYCLTA